MEHAISWFEIPVNDLSRAQKFYETIFEIKMLPMDMPGFEMRTFPINDMMTGVGGALVKTAPGFYNNSATHGVLVYLNANPDVQIILNRVEAAGGEIAVPKTQISDEHGNMGIFIDTEGNRIGLHSV
jgi:uncharacterized protein